MKYEDLSLYHYHLPPELIAQRPMVPRDAARMLVYRKQMTDNEKQTVPLNGTTNNSQPINSSFNHLDRYIDENYVIVCNNTKVIPARVIGHRKTGGKVEILFLNEVKGQRSTINGQHAWKVMLSRHINLGELIYLPGGQQISVERQEEKYFFVRTSLSSSQLISYLNKYGAMPVPPYIDHPDVKSKLKDEYQTVFAKEYGSVAAPTASLHFTNRLLNKLQRRGVTIEYITLHVGLGTFAPLEAKNFETQTLHHENYHIDPLVWRRLLCAKQLGKKILAVGTTSVRVLETVAQNGKLSGTSDLFISPGYKFSFVDAMITNFHLPSTSLLLLVSTFIGDRAKTLSLYQHAILEKYRFYSFGDGMLIL